MMKLTSRSEEESIRIAADFARKLSGPVLVCLYGDLGAGKSVFARAMIRGLCDDPYLEVPSPTFTLVQEYDTKKEPVYHFDLYRIGSPEEIYELGWDEILHDGIVIVEWPERLEGLLPEARIDVMIGAGLKGPDSRVIEVRGEM